MELIFAVLVAGFMHHDATSQVEALEQETSAAIEANVYELIELDLNMTAVHQDLAEIEAREEETTIKLATSTSSNRGLIGVLQERLDAMQVQIDNLAKTYE